MSNSGKKAVKITAVDLSKLTSEDFSPPTKFYFINALSQAVFIHCRDRKDAEQYLTDNYGKGFYKLRTSSLETKISGKNNGELTCRGYNTRKGFSSRLKKS